MTPELGAPADDHAVTLDAGRFDDARDRGALVELTPETRTKLLKGDSERRFNQARRDVGA